MNLKDTIISDFRKRFTMEVDRFDDGNPQTELLANTELRDIESFLSEVVDRVREETVSEIWESGYEVSSEKHGDIYNPRKTLAYLERLKSNKPIAQGKGEKI